MSKEKNLSLEDINKQKALLEINEKLMLEKAFTSTDPEAIMKAQGYLAELQKRNTDHKSYIFDPQALFHGLGYKDKPISLTYTILRQMAQSPIINSIIGTRQDQVSAFATPTDDIRDPGWTIRKKRKLFQPKKEMTKQEQYKATAIADFIMNCGIEGEKWKKETYEDFDRMTTKDSLELDQLTFEIQRNRKGQPIGFFATDGGTYRLADTYDDDEAAESAKNKEDLVNGHYPSYVQIYTGQVWNKFYPWELCFGIRNKSTNVLQNGYGKSELEILIKIVTYLLYTDTYNGLFFSQGSNPKGMARTKGMNQSKLMEFRQQWAQQVAGIGNVHKTLVVDADSFEWIDMQKTNKEMEFSKFQEYLIKVGCAVYKIHPSEVMDLKEVPAGMFGGGNVQQKLDFSKEKGLIPLLKFKAAKINKYLVSEIDEEYEFIHTGVQPEDIDKILEADIKKLINAGMSMQDFFKKYSDREFDPKNDMILNQIFLQYKQMEQYGSQDSNQAVDEQTDETQKANDNPMMDDLNKFIKDELMSNEKIVV